MIKSVNLEWVMVKRKEGIDIILITPTKMIMMVSCSKSQEYAASINPFYVSYSMYNEDGEPLVERDFEG